MATTFSQRIAARKPISPDLASVTAWLTGLSCVAVLLSIALSQILLGAALAGLLLSRRKLDFPARWLLPLLAFAGWTLLSLAFSSEPASGLPQIRKFFVFFLLALVINAFQNHRQLWLTVQGVLSGGVVAALYGLGQFTQDYLALRRQGMEFYENYVVHQITGFMGHWMTYGGQLMLVFLLLLAIRLFAAETLSRAGRWLCWLSMFLVCLALLGAFTRGIWLGTLAAVAYLIARYRLWLVGLLPVAVAALYLLSPSWLQERDRSIFQPQQDSSSRSRIVMFQAGLRMIGAHPVLGLGPERIGAEFSRYTIPGEELPPAWYGHLHNTFLQIAAERGIPCLIIFLWLLYEVFREHLERSRRASGRERALAMGALAATLGLMVAGLFEYNFGDSEVVMLYLFVISAPVAWSRLNSSPGQHSRSGEPA